MLSTSGLHVFRPTLSRLLLQSKCDSRLAHNTLRQFNLPVLSQLKPLTTVVSLAHPSSTVVASTRTVSLPQTSLTNILQFARTQLHNATHRDLFRSGRYSSFRRPPRRPNWLDSVNGNVIFVSIIAINAGVFLLWQGAKSTYVRIVLWFRVEVG